MKFTLNIIAGLSILFLLSAKIIAQNDRDDGKDRVIYEQPMAYDDVLKMKEKVGQIKAAQKEENSGSSDSLIDKINNNSSDENSKTLEMLKELLSKLGIDSLPENSVLPAQDAGSNIDGSDRFKKWEGQHDWKGLSSEQK